MKKINKILFLLILLTPILILFSCSQAHVHSFEDEWTYDAVGHWHKATCEHTELTKGFENHTLGAWITTKEATETEDGSAERKCSICDYKETKVLPKIEHVHTFSTEWSYDSNHHFHNSTCGHDVTTTPVSHTFSSWNIKKDATEDEAGLKERTCTVCGYVEEVVIEKLSHTHTFSSEWSYNENYHYHASTCNHDVISGEANHTFGDWIVTKDATETETGTKEKVCTVCGYKVEAEIGKLEHVHTFSNDWTYDEVNHWHAATCSHDVISNEANHTFGEWKVTKNATETETGLKERICTICGYKDEEVIEKITHVHTYSDEWTYDEEKHWHASTCGHNVIKDEEAHDFSDWDITKDATEEETGLESRICNICGYEEEREIEKLPHTHKFSDDWSYDSLNHWHDSTCGHDVKDGTAEHTFKAWKILTPATEESTGLKERTCRVCGYTEESIIEKLPHTHTFEDTWTYDEDGHWHNATCSHTQVKGNYSSHTYQEGSNICSVCGYEKVGDIPVDDNYTVTFSWSSDYQTITVTVKNSSNEVVKEDTISPAINVTKNPTCEENGNTTYNVSYTYKGVLYTDTKDVETSALGHSYVFDTFNWNEDDYSVKAVYVCSNDNTHKDIIDVPQSDVSLVITDDNEKCLYTYTVTYQGNTDSITKNVEHVYGAWVITTPATTTSTGLKEKECTNCGHKITEVIAKLPEESETDDIWTEGIYTGDYYSLITSSMLNDASLLKSTLNTIINTNYTNRSYAKDQELLRTVDSYDGYYVECIYSGVRLEKIDAWDREHIWSKSYGFNDTSYYAYSDMHHLRVSEHSVNVNKSNKLFAEVKNPTDSDKFGNKWTSEYFEPRDDIKGDVARMLLYMTVKYNAEDGLNLELSDNLDDIANCASKFGGSTPTGQSADKYINGITYYGLLSDIIKWHFEDPVDAREVYRNNVLEGTNYHKNRNPFIDHPEYVYYLYKDNNTAKAIMDNYISSEADLLALNAYMNYNQAAIDAINSKISTIGTVSLDSKDLLDEINNDYNNLGKVTKSFVNNYHILKDANDTYQALYELENQDKNVATKFSLLGIANKAGSGSKNGIDLSYEGSAFHTDHGISAQVDKNGNYSDAVIKVSGLYDTIKYLKFAWNNNNVESTASVTITDKNGKVVTATNLLVKKGNTKANDTTSIETIEGSKNRNSVYIDISSLDYSGELTIVIRNTAGQSSSVRIAVVGFTLTNTQ